MSPRAPAKTRRARPVLSWAGRFALRRRRAEERGQALVEFAFVLLPVLLLVVGIVQFGLLFGANVTLTNAAREAARAGTIYVYDQSISSDTKYRNDAKRCGDVVGSAAQAFGFLSPSAPYFDAPLSGGDCPTPTGETLVNGDVTISYCDHVATPDAPCPDGTDPDTACVLDTREGCLIRVTVTYRSDIVVPLIGPLLGTDENGRFVQQATATMVIN
jgi:hypothetical protein